MQENACKIFKYVVICVHASKTQEHEKGAKHMRNVDFKAFRIAMINANYESFSQLSVDTGIDKITLSNVCNGRQKPSYDTIEKLADALHLSYEELGALFFYREFA